MNWVRHRAIARRLKQSRATAGVEDSILLPLTSIPERENNGSKRLSPTPSVSNLSLMPCRYLSTVTRSSSQGSVDGFRRQRLQRFATFRSRCKGPFWGAYFWRGLSTEGNLRFKIVWASLIVGSKFTVFAVFYFVFAGNFQISKYKPPGKEDWGWNTKSRMFQLCKRG